MDNKHLHSYICEIENIVPPDLCARILAEYGPSDEWRPAQVGTNTVSKDIRNVDSLGLSMPDVIAKNQAVRKALDDEMFACASAAIQAYNDRFPLAKIEQDSGYDLLRYTEGQFYKEHVDSFKAHPRAISCSFVINDDYEGGGFGFFQQELVYKPKLGSALMFPSNFMFPHEVLPVTRGTRYSIISWFI
jgi:predicted 2-oxoglutarate/Fe(II)-dependent dioxygenase YbiX